MPDNLIQCTKCGRLIGSDNAKLIRFYVEHKPLPYCQRCYDAILYVHQRNSWSQPREH